MTDETPGIIVSSFASRSSGMQVRDDDLALFVVNPGTISTKGSLSIFTVRDVDGNDRSTKVTEIPVGNHPVSVSIPHSGTRVFVSNGQDATVSVIDTATNSVAQTIPVPPEPRGTALSPSGKFLYVASFANGTLAVVDTSTATVIAEVPLGGVQNPYAVLCTNDGDQDETDETIYVTDFYARPRPGKGIGEIEVFNDGKEGRVAIVSAATNTVVGQLPLDPMASGFTADRTAFASPPAIFPTFAAPAGVPVDAVPQQAYFNQLYSMCDNPLTGLVYVTSIAASPEPPVRFNTNIQALVGVFDSATNTGVPGAQVNLNDLIKIETQPDPPFEGNLTRAFAGDIVDVVIRGGRAMFVSRSGSYALRANIGGDGKLSLGNSAAKAATRIGVGNIPTAVAMNSDGTRAYVYSSTDFTFQAINVGAGSAIGKPVPTSDLPAVGSDAHNALMGELVFFTGMGTPANGLKTTSVRNLNTRNFRGLASDNNWSSCGSCHPNGLADGVTWSFDTGPRQTLPLDAVVTASGSFQKSLNWNSVRSSLSDFNNNTRNVQGGFGFTPEAFNTLDAGGALATVPDAGTIFNHSTRNPTQALELMDFWMRVGIRSLSAPKNLDQAAVTRGRGVFGAQNCAQCHGGELWTSSKVLWNLPLFDKDPANPGPPLPVLLDPRVELLGALGTAAANVVRNFDPETDGIFQIPIITQFAGASPTLNPADPIEMRGAGAAAGQASVGAGGSFNPPTLVGLAASAPYGHHGRAQALDQVFTAGGVNHPFAGSATELNDLVQFLRSIDGKTPTF